MGAPFERFEVKRSWFTRRFNVWALGGISNIETTSNQWADWRTDVKRFIEDAIREKLERELRP